MKITYADSADLCRSMMSELPPANIQTIKRHYGYAYLHDKSHEEKYAAAILTRLLKGAWPDMSDEIKSIMALRLLFGEDFISELSDAYPEESKAKVEAYIEIASVCTAQWHRGSYGNRWLLEKNGLTIVDDYSVPEQHEIEARGLMRRIEAIAHKLNHQ